MALSQEFSFAGLQNSADEHQIPLGLAYESSNASFEDGAVKGGPRYGDRWERTSAHAGDTGRGMFYAEYGAQAEYLAVVKHNGDATSRLYSVNPSTGVFTPVTRTAPPTGEDPQAIPDGDVHFAQYEDKVFAIQVATGALYVRTVGGGATDADRWKIFRPEFLTSADLTVSTSRPEYPEVDTKNVADTLSYVANGTGKPNWSIFTNPSAQGVRFAKSTSGSGYVDGTIVLTKGAATDFTDASFASFRISKDSTTGDPAVLHFVKVYLSDDVVGAVNATWLSNQAICHETQITFQDAGDDWVVRLDLRNVDWLGIDKANIKRFGFRVTVTRNRPPFTSYLDFFEVGGKDVRPVTGTPSSIEYAYAYYNPTSGALSGAVKAELLADLTQGWGPSPGLAPMGVHVLLGPSADAGLNAAGYTQIKILRRRLPTTGGGLTPDLPGGGSTADWREVSYGTVIANAGTPTFTDKVQEASLGVYPVYTPEFSTSFASSVEAQAIGVWKQHLVLGLDRRIFFSYPGLPYLFMPSPELLTRILDDLPQNLGRTVYMSSGKVEPVLDIVAQDVFYAFGDRGGYAMLGDTAGEATPPRLLNGSKGSVSRRGQAGWLGGALIAARDALWWTRANRQMAYVAEDTAIREETTSEVRKSWQRLFGTSGGNAVVVEHDDEIWVWNNYTSDSTSPGPGGAGANVHSRFMRLTRPLRDTDRRMWEEGTFPKVVSAASARGRGLRVMVSDGGLVRVGTDDTGARYTTDNGAGVNWSVSTGKLMYPRRKVTSIAVYAKGTPTITVTANDGLRGESTWAGTVQENRVLMLDVNVFPGFTHKINVSGLVGRDELYSIRIGFDKESEGLGS